MVYGSEGGDGRIDISTAFRCVIVDGEHPHYAMRAGGCRFKAQVDAVGNSATLSDQESVAEFRRRVPCVSSAGFFKRCRSLEGRIGGAGPRRENDLTLNRGRTKTKTVANRLISISIMRAAPGFVKIQMLFVILQRSRTRAAQKSRLTRSSSIHRPGLRSGPAVLERECRCFMADQCDECACGEP